MAIKKGPKEERMKYLAAKRSNDGAVSFADFDPFRKFQIVCIVGSRTVHQTTLSSKGELRKLGEGMSMPGRILNICDD